MSEQDGCAYREFSAKGGAIYMRDYLVCALGDDETEEGLSAAEQEMYARIFAAAPVLLKALDTIAKGMTNNFPGAPDVMNVTPEVFRSEMWSWSQKVARAALSAARPEGAGG